MYMYTSTYMCVYRCRIQNITKNNVLPSKCVCEELFVANGFSNIISFWLQMKWSRIQWQQKDPWGVCNQNKIWNKSALSMGVLCVLYKVCRKKKIATHLVKNIFCVTPWKTHLGHTAHRWHFATLHWEQLLVFDRQCLYWCRNAVCSTWLFHTCDMTHSHVWPTWLIHTCDMTRLYVCHDPFICVPWPIHMCAMTHSYVWHDSLVYPGILRAASYVCHDPFICATWLI